MATAKNPKLSALIAAAKGDLGDSKKLLLDVVKAALADHNGNITKTAVALDTGFQTLQRLLTKYPELRRYADKKREAERLRSVGPAAIDAAAEDDG